MRNEIIIFLLGVLSHPGTGCDCEFAIACPPEFPNFYKFFGNSIRFGPMREILQEERRFAGDCDERVIAQLNRLRCIDSWTPPWTTVQKLGCLRGSCVHLHEAPLSWSLAEQECGGGSLLKINDTATMTFVTQRLEAVAKSIDELWIGGYGLWSETWSWTDGQQFTAEHLPGMTLTSDPDGGCAALIADSEGVSGHNVKCATDVGASTAQPEMYVALCESRVSHSNCKEDQSDATYSHDDHCYQLLPTQPVTWSEARWNCIQRGAHLAKITTPALGQALAEFVRNMSDVHGFTGAWIGLHRTQWKWIDGSPLEFTMWRPGYPRDEELSSGSRVPLTLYWNAGGWWWSHSPGGVSRPFLCQTASTSGETTSTPAVTWTTNSTSPGSTSIASTNTIPWETPSVIDGEPDLVKPIAAQSKQKDNTAIFIGSGTGAVGVIAISITICGIVIRKKRRKSNPSLSSLSTEPAPRGRGRPVIVSSSTPTDAIYSSVGPTSSEAHSLAQSDHLYHSIGRDVSMDTAFNDQAAMGSSSRVRRAPLEDGSVALSDHFYDSIDAASEDSSVTVYRYPANGRNVSDASSGTWYQDRVSMDTAFSDLPTPETGSVALSHHSYEAIGVGSETSSITVYRYPAQENRSNPESSCVTLGQAPPAACKASNDLPTSETNCQ